MQHPYLGVVGIYVYPLFNYFIPVTPILFFAEQEFGFLGSWGWIWDISFDAHNSHHIYPHRAFVHDAASIG